MKRLLLTLTTILVICAAASTAAAETPAWTFKGAKWYAMMETGNVVVGLDTGLAMLDGETGQTLWKRDDLKGIKETEYTEINYTPILLIADNSGTLAKKTRLFALDQLTGQTLWETDKVYGYTVQVSPVPNRDAVVFLTTKSSAATKDKPDIAALKLTTGELLWQTEYTDKVDLYLKEKIRRSGSGASLGNALFGNPFGGFTDQPRYDLSGENPPIFEGDAMYLTYAGLHRYDLKTGSLVWKASYDVTDGSLKKTNGQAIIDGETIYTSANNVIRAIDKNTGAVRWQSKDYGKGGMAEIQLHGETLYGRMGGQFFSGKQREYLKKTPIGVVALNKTSGAEQWIYTGAKNSITNMVVLPNENVMLVGDEKNLIGLDLASQGKVKEAYKIPLKFKFKLGAGAIAGKVAKIGFGGLSGAFSKGPDTTDEPVALVRQENGTVVARGRQHLLAFNPATKEIVWSTRFEAPGVSGWQQIAMTAITFATAVMQQANKETYASRGDWGSAFSENDRLLANLTSYQNFMQKRYSSTKQSGNVVYVLTDLKNGKDKGAGVVGVNLLSGQGVNQLMFKDKKPDYEVDETAGRLFNLDKDTLAAYKINETVETAKAEDDDDEKKDKKKDDK
jgi:outer membrane protein assembly factor BamB